MTTAKFCTEYQYTDRETKQKYVSLKYKDILIGNILDVGADEGYLKKYLPATVKYTGIGLGGKNPDILDTDLERSELQFEDHSFDCVICLDVLEHLENVHDVFGELCRVSREWILISLPNPYNDLFHYLRNGKYMNRDTNMKFYGLPIEKNEDRHKWFYSAIEANEFVSYNAKKNNFSIYDYYAGSDESLLRLFQSDLKHTIFKKDFDFSEITTGTMWWVLRRNDKNTQTH